MQRMTLTITRVGSELPIYRQDFALGGPRRPDITIQASDGATLIFISGYQSPIVVPEGNQVVVKVS